MFNNFFFQNSCRLWDNADKFWTNGQATSDNILRHMRWACWITKAAHTPAHAHTHTHTPAHTLTHTHSHTHTHTHTQNMYRTYYCFPTAKIHPNTHESCVIRTFPILFLTFPRIYRDYYEVHRFSREGLKTNNIHKSLCLSSILLSYL
jgi:hypothetical protein